MGFQISEIIKPNNSKFLNQYYNSNKPDKNKETNLTASFKLLLIFMMNINLIKLLMLA